MAAEAEAFEMRGPAAIFLKGIKGKKCFLKK